MRRLAARLGAAAVFACLAPSAASADEVIQAAGPIHELHVGGDLSCQVSYGDASYEFYPPDVAPGDCGAFVAVDGTLYAPDFGGHGKTATSGLGSYEPFTEEAQSSVSGSGTATSPYSVETLVRAGASEITLRQRVSYVAGAPSFRVDLTVTNDSKVTRTLRLFHGADCYASGSDIGLGFTRPEIGAIGCSQNEDNVPPARTVQYSPLSAGSSGTEDRYYRVWEQIAELDSLDDLCLCSLDVDNGAGLSWELTLPPASSETRSLSISFTEETTTPPQDSDGDALPDSWETGAGTTSNSTNLAPLGADPNRKDIFVHADYMSDCRPPAGWERAAVALFARHGIALHIDSGPDSLNADGSEWGGLSRAGEVEYVDPLAIQDAWGPVDALKDARFVPADRRRAFHYALFAKSYLTRNDDGQVVPDDGGLSRGIPDADILIANCGFEKRADAVFLVHELGHNLGLRHGGADGVNLKPNYHSVMNYAWAHEDMRRGRLTDLSVSRRPYLDEAHLSERDGLQGPLIWWCVDRARSRRGTTVYSPREVDEPGVHYDLDLDCDGTTGEGARSSDVNADGSSDTLVGHNDWANLTFGGAGVIGALDLPQRHDTAPEPELTSAEVHAHAVAVRRARKAVARQLVVRASKRRIHGRRTTKLKIVVTAGGRTVRGARVRVNGARVVSPHRRALTGRRGQIATTLKPARRAVVIRAQRRGFKAGAVILPVTRGRR